MILPAGGPQGSILGPILFLLYFNDLEEVLKYSSVITFADDTVLYVGDPSFTNVENNLNEDLEALSNFLNKNQLVINLKKNKTESVLFGTAKRLKACPGELNLNYRNFKIIAASTYKYLGSNLDTSLNMNDNFNCMYKRVSSKLRLLSALKPYLTTTSLKKIYEGIIVPTIIYNCIINLNYSSTQLKKLESIDRRVEKIIGQKNKKTVNEIYQHTVIFVKKCINKDTCENFCNYFQIKSHGVHTRNNSSLLVIPKVRLQFAKSGFFSMGVKIYNVLPLDIRQTDCYSNLKER